MTTQTRADLMAHIAAQQTIASHIQAKAEGVCILRNEGTGEDAQTVMMEEIAAMAADLTNGLDSAALPKPGKSEDRPPLSVRHDNRINDLEEVLSDALNLVEALQLVMWELQGETLETPRLKGLRGALTGIADALEGVMDRGFPNSSKLWTEAEGDAA